MLDKRRRKTMETLESIYKVVQQSSSGITAKAIALKLNIHRTTVHNHLSTLELMGKVKNEHGLWYPKEESEQQVKEAKPNIFEFLVRNADSPFIKDMLRELENREFQKLLEKHLMLSREGRFQKKEAMKEIMEFLNTSKIRAVKQLMRELGYDGDEKVEEEN